MPSVVSLLDRGFIHAIAHIRGGREKGDRWYKAGRLLRKRNTFTDFIAATETLIARSYADRQAVFAQGGSAGGLVMGVIANLRPELYAGLVAEVPFVDVVTTMSDPSLPLTTLEYEEWGNPAVKREYDYMLSYSPYDNVVRKNYPAMTLEQRDLYYGIDKLIQRARVVSESSGTPGVNNARGSVAFVFP